MFKDKNKKKRFVIKAYESDETLFECNFFTEVIKWFKQKHSDMYWLMIHEEINTYGDALVDGNVIIGSWSIK